MAISCMTTNRPSKKLLTHKNILHFRVQDRTYISFQLLKNAFLNGKFEKKSVQEGVI